MANKGQENASAKAKGEGHWNRGRKRPDLAERNKKNSGENSPSHKLKGEKHWNTGRQHLYKSKNKGEKNGRYIDGRTDKKHIIRESRQYKEWRKAVYDRDNYTCQCCLDNQGGNLNAHHIVPFMKDESKRFDVDNGITLCEKCHRFTHKMKRVKQ